MVSFHLIVQILAATLIYFFTDMIVSYFIVLMFSTMSVLVSLTILVFNVRN